MADSIYHTDGFPPLKKYIPRISQKWKGVNVKQGSKQANKQIKPFSNMYPLKTEKKTKAKPQKKKTIPCRPQIMSVLIGLQDRKGTEK